MKMKQTLALILPTMAVFSGSAFSATVYNIDIGLNATTSVKSGYTGLVTPFTGSGGTVTIDGDVFTLSGQTGGRDRGLPNPNTTGIDLVTSDFAFAETGGGNVQITLALGAAGALQAGTWQLSVYSADWNIPAGVQNQRIGITTTTGAATSEVTYGAAVDQKLDGPATTFTFTSDGVSAYTLFVRDSLADTTQENQVRLNGIDLVLIPEPSTALLGAIGSLALLRRRR